MACGSRFRFVAQRDAMQCGVACLCMVCNAMGKHLSLEEAGRLCHATREGVSLKGIRDAAEGLGLESAAARVSLAQLRKLPLPAILHWEQRHFVVLHRISKNGGRFHVADPAKGMAVYTDKELLAGWSAGGDSGIAMVFEPGEGFSAVAAEEGGRVRPFAFLFGYIMRYRAYFTQIALGLLLGCALQLILPFLTQWIVDIGIRHGDIRFIWLVLLGELMIVAGRTAADFIRRWLLLHISMRVNISLLSDFIAKLLRLPMSYFDTKLVGDLTQRMADHGRVQSFLTGQALGLMFTLLSFAVFGVVLLVYDRLVFLVFLSGSAAYAAWCASFLRRRRLLERDMFHRQADCQNRTFQLLTSMQEIKLQDCRRRRRWEWEDAQAGLFGVQMRSMRLQQTQEAGSVLINEVKNILITVLSAQAVIDGGITLGAMLAIQYIVGQLNSPVEQLMGFLYSLQDVRLSLERIDEIHSMDDEDAHTGALARLDGDTSVSLRGVCFRYDPHATSDTVSGVSFDIPPGKVTAIVGASGSGKTTLIKLMLGYYPVREGVILLSGKDLGEYDPEWWRRQCGVVMQDGVIFHESIARNIAAGDGEIDRGRMEEAARTACIHDFVSSLPLGYDTVVGGDGMGLSQGQKQRILIARAVYRDPGFIFLDEATNSLDAANERAIVENLAGFYRGRTVVVVAHRLSTVRGADSIIVMDSGRVAESGTHSELVSRKGVYYNLVRNQLELGN